MKKNTIIYGLLFLLLIVICFVVFKNITFESTTMLKIYEFSDQPSTKVELSIPKFSFNIKDDNKKIEMKNIRSIKILKQELNEIVANYKKINCNGKNYYYNESNDFTIHNYGVKNNYIYNTIYYEYSIGNACEQFD